MFDDFKNVRKFDILYKLKKVYLKKVEKHPEKDAYMFTFSTLDDKNAHVETVFVNDSGISDRDLVVSGLLNLAETEGDDLDTICEAIVGNKEKAFWIYGSENVYVKDGAQQSWTKIVNMFKEKPELSKVQETDKKRLKKDYAYCKQKINNSNFDRNLKSQMVTIDDDDEELPF